MASTVLTKTPTAGNRLKWTFSTWFKFKSGGQCIFGGNQDGNNYNVLQFSGTSQIDFLNVTAGSVDARLITNRLFRDSAAWYHVVAVWDSANASAGDRMRLYINGVEETSFATDTNPSSSLNSIINSANELSVGGYAGGSNFNGSMAHSHFCDGYAYAASDFGETDSTSGIWVAKTSPSVSYGSNGFFFKYQDTSAFGDDSSGNTNDFALSGTMTQTKDTPDNNFTTWNPLLLGVYGPAGTYTNGNTTWASTGGNYRPVCATVGLTAGLWYWEAKQTTHSASQQTRIGISGDQYTDSPSNNYSLGYTANQFALIAADGNSRTNNTATAYGVSVAQNDIIGVYMDLTANKLYFAKNGVVMNSGTGITITAASTTSSQMWVPATSYDSASTGTFETNFGNGYFGSTVVTSGVADAGGEGTFEYDPSAGTFDGSSKDFRAICTNNLGTYGG